MAELKRLATKLGATSGDRFLGVAPFSHVNGLVRTMMHSMYLGATLYPVADFRRREVIELVARERITFMGAIPHVFVALGQTSNTEPADFSHLRIVFSSSAPLLVEDSRQFQAAFGIPVRQLYGSTETGTMSVNMDATPDSFADSVGTPLEGVRFEIRAQDGQPVLPRVEGDIVVASDIAISAYAGNAEATKEAFDDGSYLTGDLGYLDEAGRLYLKGRKKFVINRGGFKVNPHEVEKAISTHPAVSEVVVFGSPSGHGDDVVSCAIVAVAPCTASEIVDHCRPLIADFKIPGRIEFRDELPKSTSGKVLRNEL